MDLALQVYQASQVPSSQDSSLSKGLSSSTLDDIKTKMDKAQCNKNKDDDDEEDHKPTAQEKKQAEEAQDANDSDDSDDDGPMKKK